VGHHGKSPLVTDNIHFHPAGRDPFYFIGGEKKRLTGAVLVFRMLLNSLKAVWVLWRINPDEVVLAKPLPENVLAVKIWRTLRRRRPIIVDADDFELLANATSNLIQRAAIHWSERAAVNMADKIVTASPFLQDHYRRLKAKQVYMVPTGLPDEFCFYPRAATGPAKIVYAGSLSMSSGHRVDMLPEIVKKVRTAYPNIRLIIAGSGHDKNALERAIVRAGLSQHTQWIGRFSAGSLKKVLDEGSVIVDPIDSSVTNRAKSSFRTCLAVYMGLPIVTSDVGIRPYLIPPFLHRIFFAEPGVAQDYGQKVVDILNRGLNKQERADLKLSGKNLTWEKLAQAYKALL